MYHHHWSRASIAFNIVYREGMSCSVGDLMVLIRQTVSAW